MHAKFDSEKENVLIIGGKGTAVNLAELMTDAELRFGTQQHFCGFLIDDDSLGTEINGYSIFGKTADAVQASAMGYKLIYALYKPSAMYERVVLFKRLGLSDAILATFIHPLATVMKSAKIAAGVAIFPGVVIGSNAHVGVGSIINSSVVIEHDTRLGCHNFIAAGAGLGSEIEVGEGNFIGLNSCVRENIRIGNYNLVGMGTVVVDDIKNNEVIYGCPGKPRAKSMETAKC